MLGLEGGAEADDDSIDSVLTPPKAQNTSVMKLAAATWRGYDEDVRKSWKYRAESLNCRPLPGHLDTLPSFLQNDIDCQVMNCLEMDWRKVVRVFKGAICQKPKRNMSSRTYVFASLFGHDFSKLAEHEVISQTKRSILIHISSQRRMNDLFTVAGLSAASFKKNKKVFSCAGKVNTIYEDRNLTGFIVDENKDDWRIKLSNEELFIVERGVFDSSLGKYSFPKVPGRRVSEFWPIRIEINQNGESRLTLNRVTFDNNLDRKSVV